MDTKHEQPPLLNEQETNVQRPVECLGLTFESDEARRTYFLEILREKLRDSEFREIEGFPIGDDEDILALSDPHTTQPARILSLMTSLSTTGGLTTQKFYIAENHSRQM